MSEHPPLVKKRWIILLLCVFFVPLVGWYGVRVWRHYSTYVSTDNAYVQADMAQITPRVPGTVSEVSVGENWWVKPGDVLVRLDPRDYEVRLAEARAMLARARETVEQLFAAVAVADGRKKTSQSQIQAARSEVAAAQAEFRWAELDWRRAEQLMEEKVVPVQRLDRAKTHYDAALSRLHAKQQQLEEVQKNAVTREKEWEQARAALGSAASGERSEHSLIKQAEAAVREAELNLSYCTLTAPIEGVVSRKSIEIGQQVQAGQPLMAIVPLHRAYIEANFKETQLTHVRVGQPAEIRADIYPDQVYRGEVESLSGGTGSAFSLLPPENATGNWVKVVQRLPVKIVFTESPPTTLPLRVGLSVEVSIDTSNRQGPLLNALYQGDTQAPVAVSPTARLEPDRRTLSELSAQALK